MARYDGRLFFSPRFSFSQLDFSDTSLILDAFQDRVEGFYLVPAQQLAYRRNYFASGVLCLVGIDFVSKYEYPTIGDGRFKAWLNRIPPFGEADPGQPNRHLSDRMEQDFRNMLVHEGRIRFGEFSCEIRDVARVMRRKLIVNPRLLTDRSIELLHAYCDRLRSNALQMETIRQSLLDDFRAEVVLEGVRVG